MIGCFHLCHASFLNGHVRFRSRIDRGEQRTHGDSWLFPHLNPYKLLGLRREKRRQMMQGETALLLA